MYYYVESHSIHCETEGYDVDDVVTSQSGTFVVLDLEKNYVIVKRLLTKRLESEEHEDECPHIQQSTFSLLRCLLLNSETLDQINIAQLCQHLKMLFYWLF